MAKLHRVLTLALTGALGAQVFIVDAAGGSGAHFTDLPPAVATVPDGATLRVRPGSYTPFTLVAQGLRVVGEGLVTLDRTVGNVDIRGTRADQVVLLRGLSLPPLSQVLVLDAVGPVILEACRRSPSYSYAGSIINAIRCANLQILGCTLDPGQLLLNPPGSAVAALDSVLQIANSTIAGPNGGTAYVGRSFSGGFAVDVVRSHLTLVASTLSGGNGGPGCRQSCGLPGCWADGGHGGAACRVQQATLVVLGCTLVGGGGGQGAYYCSYSTCPGDGGPGLEVVDSRAFMLGRQPAGGPAGSTACGAQPGVSTRTVGQSSIQRDPLARPPVAQIEGTQAIGQTVSLTAFARAGSQALLAFAYRGDLLPLAQPPVLGSWLSAMTVSFGPFTVPVGDVLRIPVTIPSNVLGQVFFFQFLTTDSGSLFGSNPVPLLASR